MWIYTSPDDDVDLPADCKSLYKFLEEKLTLHGTKTALVEGLTGKSYTYEEIKLLIRHTACGLYQYGLRRGDVILIAAHNCPEFLLVEWGALAIGGIVSCVSPKITKHELIRALGIARCKGEVRLIITNKQSYECVNSVTDGKLEKVFCFDDVTGCLPFSDILKSDVTTFASISSEVKSSDAATLYFSSGTTGAPKGILSSQNFYISNATLMIAANLDPREVTLAVMQFYHNYSFLVVNLVTLCLGATVVIIPNYSEVDVVLKMIENYQVDNFVCSPALLIALLPMIRKHGVEKLSWLREISCGGSALHPSIISEYSEKLPHIRIRQLYGMTELGLISAEPLGSSKSDGRTVLLPNVKAKIVDRDTGKALGPGCQGEVLIKTPSVLTSYLNNPEEFARSFTEDGYFRTGDVGTFDKEGKLLIIERIKNMIKVYNRKELTSNAIVPTEIEAVVMSHPDVADAAVVGIDDPGALNYDLPRAYVVRKNLNLSEEDVTGFVKERLSEVKWLTGGVKFVDVLPRSGLGKIQRHLLLAADKSLNKINEL